MMTEMSEPAIRNYELGNRTPSERQLQKIADALRVNIFAISNPNLDASDGLLQALFSMEDSLGLATEEIAGKTVLTFPRSSASARYIGRWQEVRSSYLAGEITKEEYDEWRYSYPRVEAELTRKHMDELRQKRRLNT